MYWASHCFSQNIKGEFLSFDNLFRHAQCIENRMFSDMFNCSFIFNCKSVRTQLQDPFSYALMFLPFLQKKSFSNLKKKICELNASNLESVTLITSQSSENIKEDFLCHSIFWCLSKFLSFYLPENFCLLEFYILDIIFFNQINLYNNIFKNNYYNNMVSSLKSWQSMNIKSESVSCGS